MEYRIRSSLEVNRVIERLPQTLSDIETVVDHLLKSRILYQRDLIERKIQPRVFEINQVMQELKGICEIIKSELDAQLEEKEQEISLLKDQIRSIKLQISSKSTEVNHLEIEKSRSESVYEDAQQQLDNARMALSAAESKLQDAKNAQIGVGVSSVPVMAAAPVTAFIPIVGTFIAIGTALTGYSMFIASLTVIENEIREKRSILYHCEANKQSFENKLSEISDKINKLQKDINDKRYKERQLQFELDLLSKSQSDIEVSRRKMTNFLRIFNTGFHQLTVASGRSRALNSQTINAYNIDHLKPLLQAFMESFSTFSRTEMFARLNYSSAISQNYLQILERKVQQIPTEQQQLTYSEWNDLV